MEIISRKLYADKVDSWIGKSQVIVLTGQRRVGKSYVLKDFINRHQNEADANIIYIDKEKRDFAFIKNDEHLGEYIDKHFIRGKHNYILVDEIQDIIGWERTIRSFRTEDKTDIIITGSNSKMLSSELSTLLSGRYEEIHIQPLSYLEFLEFHRLDDGDEAVQMYLEYGGLPGLSMIGLNNEEHVWEYLSSIFNTVLLKDVIERYKIRNITFLNNLLAFWADTIGKVNSATSICKYMKSQQQDVSTNIILDYTSYFEAAYLLKGVKRYDIHGKKIFETNQKVYFGDVGLRNFITGSKRETDIEKVLENVIYQHLVRLGYQVYIGEQRVGEIDFVCRKTNELKYIQVAYLLKDEETIKREFGRLQDIQDNYPKYVISMTPMLKSRDYNGVTHLGLKEFLKNGL